MKKKLCFVALLCLFIPFAVLAQEASYNGLDNHLSSLYRLSNARTLSISPENPTGEKGKGGAATEGTGAKAARDLGKGWKISPSVISRRELRTPSPRSQVPERSSTSG
jgi:D-arabinan exo alpha-(1,3)/(1,5)-arabinofuranosidase (non-reducing end)